MYYTLIKTSGYGPYPRDRVSFICGGLCSMKFLRRHSEEDGFASFRISGSAERGADFYAAEWEHARCLNGARVFCGVM